jgi:very-short-patch-repair endonuclease
MARPWNKGLTKENDFRVAANGLAVGEALKGRRLTAAERITRYGNHNSLGHRVARTSIEALTRGRETQRQTRGYGLPSSLSLKLASLLGPAIRLEEPFGTYQVDCYDPADHIAYEADGAYWHNRPKQRKHDRRRDRRLWLDFGLPVLRIPERFIEILAVDSSTRLALIDRRTGKILGISGQDG